jgi:hypothetical protein
VTIHPERDLQVYQIIDEIVRKMGYFTHIDPDFILVSDHEFAYATITLGEIIQTVEIDIEYNLVKFFFDNDRIDCGDLPPDMGAPGASTTAITRAIELTKERLQPKS